MTELSRGRGWNMTFVCQCISVPMFSFRFPNRRPPRRWWLGLGLVPVAMVPQLIFSKLVLPAKSLEGPLAWMEQATLAKWSYRAMEEVTAAAPDYLALIKTYAILLAAVGVLTAFAGLALKLKDGANA